MSWNRSAVVFFGVVAVLAASFAGARVASSQAVPPARLAFIDIAEIFQKYEKSSDIQQSVRLEMQRIDQQLRKDVDEIRSKEGDLDLYVEGTEQYMELRRELDFEAFRLEYKEKELKSKVLRQAVDKMGRVYTEIRNEAENYARRNGFHAVLMHNAQKIEAKSLEQLQVMIASRPVIFRDQMMDITEPVLKILSN